MSKTLLVLIKYKDTEKIDLFIHGEDLFSSSEVHQVVENDGIAWDELRLIDYSKESLYDSDLRDFNLDNYKLDKYKILAIKRYSYLKDKFLRITYIVKNLIYSDDTTISMDRTKTKETPKQRRLRIEGNRPNIENFSILLKKSKVPRPIYLVNIIKTREIAMYPVGYNGKQISGKKAMATYSRVAYKYTKKHGNYFIFLSDVKYTIADNTGTDFEWESLGIVKYKSFASLSNFNNEPMFKNAFVHKDAGIDITHVYASFSNNNSTKLE